MQLTPPEKPTGAELATTTQPDLFISFGNAEGGLQPAFRLTDTGIEVPDDLTADQYRIGLKSFKWMRDRIDTAQARYIEIGIARFGKETVESYLAQLEFDMPDVKRSFTINSLPESVRKLELSAEHFVVLARAGLKPEQQASWAEAAVTQHLAPAQLKMAIAVGSSNPPAGRQNSGIISIHGIRTEFDMWLKRCKGADGIKKMEEGNQKEIIQELQPMYELYLELTNSEPVRIHDLPAAKVKAVRSVKKKSKFKIICGRKHRALE